MTSPYNTLVRFGASQLDQQNTQTTRLTAATRGQEMTL